jgi:multiple sugar transport system permease protein
MLIYFKNTLLIVLGVIVGGTLTSSLCAFGFSKLQFKGRDTIFFLVLATMMIPGSVMMISLYVIFNKLGWINHLYPLWVPTWFGGGAVNIFLVRQFMKTIPDELNQSAKIDGANYWQLFSRIILPNCKPILIVIIIQYFLGCWNDLMGPLLYTNTQEMWTLTLGITNMAQGQMNTTEGTHLVMAACTIMIIFPVALFLAGQRYIIDNMVLTGLKG